MSGAWTAVLLVGAGTVVLKATGPVLLAGRPLPAGLGGLVAYLAAPLLAALVVTQTFASGRHLTVDARSAGVAAAAIAIAFRAPLLAVIVVAAVVTAVVRLL